jgi:hypothetical protein
MFSMRKEMTLFSSLESTFSGRYENGSPQGGDWKNKHYTIKTACTQPSIKNVSKWHCCRKSICMYRVNITVINWINFFSAESFILLTWRASGKVSSDTFAGMTSGCKQIVNGHNHIALLVAEVNNMAIY